eukprot:jgi/Pico_ML_1/52961/g3591.t2
MDGVGEQSGHGGLLSQSQGTQLGHHVHGRFDPRTSVFGARGFFQHASDQALDVRLSLVFREDVDRFHLGRIEGRTGDGRPRPGGRSRASRREGRTREDGGERTKKKVVGILPGSKRAKIAMGVPYMLAVACALDQTYVAMDQGWATATLVRAHEARPKRTPGTDACVEGTLMASWKGMHAQVDVWSNAAPAYGLLSGCDLCVTTVGTNTAELAALGTPMVVALPTHDLAAFRGASGGRILGLMAQAPGPVGEWVARATNAALLKDNVHLSWPNMWAQAEVVPEMVGLVEPEEVAERAMALLQDEDALAIMSKRLRVLSSRAADGERTDLPPEEIDALAKEKDGETHTADAEDAADLVVRMILDLLALDPA